MSVPQSKALRAIIWCAVSDEKQAREEKISLAEQERQLRDKAEHEGWVISDVLIVPGFSRRFYNFPEFAAAAANEGIDAPNRLMQHWIAQDFDVLACRYGSRFAREQSIFGEVVARTIDMGARIYTLQDGWVDRNNYRMFISMGGYAAATEVDRLISGFQEAMTKRAEQGLPVSPQILISHKVIRNDLGKALKYVVNEKRRRLFEDFATVLLTGISWSEIPLILFENYGHAAPSGKPWSSSVLWRTVYSPWFWGHGARGYTHNGKSKKTGYGVWGFDPSVPPPNGTTIFRDTHEAMYTGELATRVMTELKRRSEVISGRAGYGTVSPFTGLLVCGSCGYRLRYKRPSNNLWEGYSCVSRDPRHRLHPRYNCESNPRTIKLSIVRDWFDARLHEMIAQHDATVLLPAEDKPALSQIDAIRGEIAEVERRIEGLLLQRVDTPAASQTVLSNLLMRSDEQLAILRRNLDSAVRRQQTSVQQQRIATDTLDQIAKMKLEAFWQLPNVEINQMLFALLGNNRVVIENRVIIGVGIPTEVK